MDLTWYGIRLICCEEGSGCLCPGSAVALIALINIVGCFGDNVPFNVVMQQTCPTKIFLYCTRFLLMILFQMASMLLLLAAIFENSTLVQLYVWYTLGFVVLGLVVALAELLLNMKYQGLFSFFTFMPEVLFLFAVSWCLPLVNTYGLHLDPVKDPTH